MNGKKVSAIIVAIGYSIICIGCYLITPWLGCIVTGMIVVALGSALSKQLKADSKIDGRTPKPVPPTVHGRTFDA